jgi:hypothetical protein
MNVQEMLFFIVEVKVITFPVYFSSKYFLKILYQTIVSSEKFQVHSYFYSCGTVSDPGTDYLNKVSLKFLNSFYRIQRFYLHVEHWSFVSSLIAEDERPYNLYPYRRHSAK